MSHSRRVPPQLRLRILALVVISIGVTGGVVVAAPAYGVGAPEAGLAVAPAPAEFVIDPRHSSTEFRIRHLGVSTVTGRFHEWSGAIVYDDENPSQSSVDVTIAVASIDTGVEGRDDHLRSDDFFGVEAFPEMRFVSTEVRPLGDETFEIVGDLTIRDVTREVVLDAELNGVIERDGRGGRMRTMGLSASTRINREDYGLTWNRALEAGGWLVGSEVRIMIEIEANHQIASSP